MYKIGSRYQSQNRQLAIEVSTNLVLLQVRRNDELADPPSSNSQRTQCSSEHRSQLSSPGSSDVLELGDRESTNLGMIGMNLMIG